ncbi:hypothetical protein [Leptothermofonsia sp. ETS-13]|uniref:hypothetical protein n=1 Tax=Leptothermofonsia sp. ETS-13 TaxID=3035696 RepID=UPI003BA15231
MNPVAAAAIPTVAVRPATSTPMDFPKPPVASAPTAIAPIPFGEKLSETSSNIGNQGAAIAPPPVTAPPSNPTSAEAFPMPGSQQPPSQAIATTPVTESAPPFPIPAALSGKGENSQPRRPMQIVRVATPETGIAPPEIGNSQAAGESRYFRKQLSGASRCRRTQVG